ncbi:MAG: hypothetical protein HY681_00205 [Chloroflexi bacterium]|nr:hypothetical protein [Chloroflexota bacterium]
MSVEAYSQFSGQNCAVFFTRPANYLKLKNEWYFWYNDHWAVCSYTDWMYNPTSMWAMTYYYDFGASPECGATDYATNGEGYEYDGGWHGGSVWSGSHYLPP